MRPSDYLHAYKVVKEVSHERKIAKVERATIDWRTRQRDFTCVDCCQVWLEIALTRGRAQ